MKKAQKEKKQAFRTRSEFTVGDVLRLKFLLQQDLGLIEGPVHYWAGFVLRRAQDIVKQFQVTLKTHAEFEAYSTRERQLGKKALKAELDKTFPAFAAHERELREQPADFTVKCFAVDWCLKYPAAASITAACVEFDLFDDPERGEELLYRVETE